MIAEMLDQLQDYNPEETILNAHSPGPMGRQDAATNAWEARFIPVVLDCTCYHGYIEADEDFILCPVVDCKQGEIFRELCVRCQLDSNHCECSVEDFIGHKDNHPELIGVRNDNDS